jgi:hypothetical protein
MLLPPRDIYFRIPGMQVLRQDRSTVLPEVRVSLNKEPFILQQKNALYTNGYADENVFLRVS